MLAALGRGIAGLYGTLGGSSLKVFPRLLHEVLPITLGLGGDTDQVEPNPHLPRVAAL